MPCTFTGSCKVISLTMRKDFAAIPADRCDEPHWHIEIMFYAMQVKRGNCAEPLDYIKTSLHLTKFAKIMECRQDLMRNATKSI